MDIQTKKHQLIQQINSINDEELIELMQKILELGLQYQAAKAVDFETNLSTYSTKRIEQSLKEMEEGKGLPHEEVMAEFRKKYN